MGVILFLLGFVIVEIQITTTNHTSSEDVNKIQDKVMQQVNDSNIKWKDEDLERSEPEQDVPNNAETKAGNDSNMYYFKIYTAPQIKFKINVQNSNKETRYEDVSEDKLLPGPSPSRSGTNYDEIEPPQYKSAEIDKNLKLLEDLFEKDIKRKATTERSPYGRDLSKALSMLHDYPEMIIDHISYNDGEDDSRPKDENEHQEFPGEPKNFLPKHRHEHTKSIIYQKIQENTNSKTDPELKNQIAEHQSNKQNILLEKILEQLSVNNVQHTPKLGTRAFSYPGAMSPLANEVRGLGLMPTYSQNLQHDVVSTTYIQTPVLTYNLAPQVPIKPFLGRSLMGLSRPVALQRARLATNLFQRGMPRTNLFQKGMPLYGRNVAILRG